MDINYFKQLLSSYPEKEELLRWLNVKLDRNIYFYGPYFKFSQGIRTDKGLKSLIRKYYYKFKGLKCSYEKAVICDAYFNVSQHIKNKGYKVELPPWITSRLSNDAMKTAELLAIRSNFNFNDLISDDFKGRVYRFKEELKEFLLRNHTPFVLLANGEQPIYRIVIDLCKEIGVPTGVFLHGLPARYGLEDNYHPDYLFVWGENIKKNFESLRYPSKIIVSGHPIFSQYKKQRKSESDIVVLSQSINFTSCAQNYVFSDPGLTIQYIYAVEQSLRSLGYTKAVLRLHPSENTQWYLDRMDKSFYTIDSKPLDDTISNAKFLVGPISTVILDAVYSGIPYFIYIVCPSINKYSLPIVPPFTSDTGMPVNITVDDLTKSIKEGRFATPDNFKGYIKEKFDVSVITQLFKL